MLIDKMEDLWEIVDGFGEVYFTGCKKEAEEVWDFITLDETDPELFQKYPLYNPDEMHDILREWDIEWEGDLKLIQIHEVFNG